MVDNISKVNDQREEAKNLENSGKRKVQKSTKPSKVREQDRAGKTGH